MGGAKFVRRTGKSANSSRGLSIGRMVDGAFTRHVNGTELYSPSSRKHGRLGHILRALSARRITLVRAQVPVHREDLGIHTTMDAVGVCNGKIVVIELKSTQHSRADHERMYDEPSLTRPVLSNGVESSERCLHQLQAAFGAICCRRLTQVEVEAVVVVSYSNSAVVHRVPESMCSSLLFSGVHAAPCGTRRAPQEKKNARRGPARFAGWPAEDSRVESVLAARGGRSVEAHGTRNTVAVLSSDGRTILVAGCLRERWSLVRGARRSELLRALLKTHVDVFGHNSKPPQTYVLSPHARHWRLHRVDPRQ